MVAFGRYMDKTIQAKTAVAQFGKARELRTKGFVNKVSALPQEAIDHIDLLFKKNVSNRAVAREINRRFHLKETFEYGELSHLAIATYKKAFEKKEAQKEAAKEVLFNSSVSIKDWTKGAQELDVANKLRCLIDHQFEELKALEEKMEGMPVHLMPNYLRSLQTERRLAFDLLVYYIGLGQAMGLVPKTVLPEGGPGAGQVKFIGDPETLKAIIKMLEAHKKRVNRKQHEQTKEMHKEYRQGLGI